MYRVFFILFFCKQVIYDPGKNDIFLKKIIIRIMLPRFTSVLDVQVKFNSSSYRCQISQPVIRFKQNIRKLNSSFLPWLTHDYRPVHNFLQEMTSSGVFGLFIKTALFLVLVVVFFTSFFYQFRYYLLLNSWDCVFD